MNITNVTARTILDSRGNPTVEAEVWCAGGGWGRAAVPSGASTGTHEVHELRDGDAAFGGKGVTKAVTNIQTEIAAALSGLPADDQARLDHTLITLDSTANKSRLGANAILAVSLAAAHAAAGAREVPLYEHINQLAGGPAMSLPMPMLNVLNGGQHATHSADFQEYMVVPIAATTYFEALQVTAEVFTALKSLLHTKGFATTVGDEGGFAPSVPNNTAMLDLLMEAAQSAGHTPGTAVAFALDVAASEFYREDQYHLATEQRALTAEEMITYLNTMSTRYPIVSIEDGLAEDDWPHWTSLTEALTDTQLVGDDLLVTNHERLTRAIKEHAGNAILIKPNQIGTLTETLNTIAAAKHAGWNTIVSHRSGETEDTSIAHIAVGTGAGQIKTGSISRGERTAKHNELLRIEDTAKGLSLHNPFRSKRH